MQYPQKVKSIKPSHKSKLNDACDASDASTRSMTQENRRLIYSNDVFTLSPF